jgi:hypothetical protein
MSVHVTPERQPGRNRPVARDQKLQGDETMTDHRIGMIVPSSNLTMETELPRMMRARESAMPADRFTFHSSRMRMKHVTAEELVRMNAQTERASLELADARPAPARSCVDWKRRGPDGSPW